MAVLLSDLLLQTYRLLEDLPGLDSITAAITTTTATSITVNDPTQWPVQSRYEIDDELVIVKTNTGANPITVQRAAESTIAATHLNNALARRDPRFLRATVKEAINYVVSNWCSHFFPKLVWDTTTAGSFTPNRWIYAAPADAMAVRRVAWHLPGFTRLVDVPFSPLQTFPTAIVSTGLGVELTEHTGLPGRGVQIEYEKRWTALNADTDPLDTDFPADAEDLIPHGAVLYIAGFRQTPKWRLDEIVFHREANQTIPANFSMAFYKERVQEWYTRATQIRNRRPVYATPQKVYLGKVF